MSGQERWDVVLRFISGPLSYQGEMVCRGPVLRMGANPGPGGVDLSGYRGLDNRQAVITAYDGGTVSIAPVGTNQVRVAPHENVNWAELQTLHGPVYLDPGSVFHLGSPGRGVTVEFVKAQRLGVWEQGRIMSDAAQLNPEVLPSSVQELDTKRGMPWWFIPLILVMGLGTTVGVGVSVVQDFGRDVAALGPVAEGKLYYERIDPNEVEVDPSLLEGLNQPFADFVMIPNANQADWKALGDDPSMWDETFFDYVTRSVTVHARAWAFWKRLERIEADYAYVVSEFRKAGLPEIFAAIPYQESQYKAEIQSVVCAKGYWQLMPEVANRAGIIVQNCKMKGTEYPYTPKRVIPIRNVLKNAEYVDHDPIRCRITGCEIDERTDLEASTRASVELLREAWEDPLLAESGSAVQITILSHNGGYDNSRFEEKKVNSVNLLPSYKKYLRKSGAKSGVNFYGDNITCVGMEYAGIEHTNSRCDGFLANQTQHYAYSIVAQHILAVCYYAKNHGGKAPFDAWRPYTRGEGYCTELKIPELDSVRKQSGK